MRKMAFLFVSLIYCCSTHSQSEVNSTENIKYRNVYFSNSKIEKTTLSIYMAPGFVSALGSVPNYFKTGFGGTMSLDYYSSNNLAYFLSFNGANMILKQNLPIDENNVWTKDSKVDFMSYGISAGYSFCNTIHWRITPFAGVVLSESKPAYHDMKESPYLKKYKIGPIPSPSLGVNLSYRFINQKKLEEKDGMKSCFAISTRVTYVPFAIYKKGNPYSGGALYLTFGINGEIF